MNKTYKVLPRKKLAAAISAITAPVVGGLPMLVQAQGAVIEEVIVTATRRSDSVQDIPINITAVSAEQIENRRLVGLDEIARFVPGLTFIDNGPRDDSPDIIIRGLNTDGLGPGGVGATTVATYLGEIPLEADFKTNDLERVEVLKGPQGTLYGSGTLGGAIRYIPKKPENEFSFDVRGSVFSLSHSDGLGSDVGATLNVPIIDNVLAFRANLDRLDDPGFIDYAFVVREAGVSNPEPDFTNPADVSANLRNAEDANGEETLSGRFALRWTPNDKLDATLWYHFQNVEAEGRQLVHQESFGTGPYQSGLRYEEPNDYDNQILSLEVIADLGFAELTSATGYTEYDEVGQRDQTDLLLDFEYGYEFFPTFSSFTRETDDEWTLTQEIRLVSTGDGPLSWIVGGFYNKFDQVAWSFEFTPGFDQFAVDNFGGVALRPDALEYIQFTDDVIEEQALFGEISYQFTDKWEATVGFRAYEFEETLTGGFDLPLLNTVFLGQPDTQLLRPSRLATNTTDDDGTLFKLNVAYQVNEDILTYLTVSEGYRIGGLNSVPPCTPDDIANPGQALCALEDEILIKPDTTTNYELGVRSSWMGNSLIVNAAVYFIDWEDIQVSDVTVNGSLPITGNGSGAESKGIEIDARWRVNENWELFGTVATTDAELTELAEGLVGPFDGPAGARLPGSPELQGSLGASYTRTLANGRDLIIGWNMIYNGDIFNIPGGNEQLPLDNGVPTPARRGEKLPSYTLHSFQAQLAGERWSATAYLDNAFDEYAITGTRTTQRFLETFRGDINGFRLRSYGRYIARPRTMGVRLTYSF